MDEYMCIRGTFCLGSRPDYKGVDPRQHVNDSKVFALLT